MIENVDGNTGTVSIQYHPGHMNVGLGLEMRGEVPGLHFIDAIYGGAPSQEKVGRVFLDKMEELGLECSFRFETGNAERDWHSDLGRAILDSVTGSSTVDGLWTNLDRPATNRLIRILRKARDLSFGKDE